MTTRVFQTPGPTTMVQATAASSTYVIALSTVANSNERISFFMA